MQMASMRHLGRSLLLTAVALGLNALIFFGHAHGSHPSNLRINYSHIPAHGSHRPTSRSGRYQRLTDNGKITADRADSKVAPKLRPNADDTNSSLRAAIIAPQPLLPEPAFHSEPIVLQHTAALVSAPRPPGSARAPPLA